MMTKHTPGPWYIESEGNPVTKWISSKEDETGPVCVVFSRNGGKPSVVDANARLITAAPEMLDALRSMLKAFNVPEIDSIVALSAVEKARAVVEKATGQD